MREQTLLIIAGLGTFFVVAGVLLIIFRAPIAEYYPPPKLIGSGTTPRKMLVLGCVWTAMGTFFAIVGFVNLF